MAEVKKEQTEDVAKEPWHILSYEDAEKKLHTSTIVGLTESEAKARLEKYGLNELKKAEKEPRWKVFLKQFSDPLIYILIAAAIISITFGELTDAVVIIVIVLLNSIVSFVEEGKADAAIEALKNITAPEANVIRDGTEMKIKAAEIVLGDIILLREGDRIPADGRVFEQSNLKTQEASLTGESVPVGKMIENINDPETALAERKNMVYALTLATYGRGKAIVTETGMNTEVGHIAEMISEATEKMTPLQKKLEQFGSWIGKIILVICAAVFVLYIIRPILNNSLDLPTFIDSLIAAIALAVAAIPEGLPTVVTISLAIGITRMAKRNAIIKKLRSVETLGCTTVICSDKTGTLTKNEMTVRAIWAGNKVYDVTGSGYFPEGRFQLDGKEIDAKNIPDLEMTLRCGFLCNNARLTYDQKTGKWDTFGDPTEGCLITSARKARLDYEEINNKYLRVEEIPFDSDRKRMTTVNRINGKSVAHIKGATEILLDLSISIQIGNEVRPITQEDKKQILDAHAAKASEALRGLGFAYRDAEKVPVEIECIEKDLTFVGMQFAIDPPREEVKLAIQKCKTAGIRVKMITGDNLITAKAIAEELGILSNGGLIHEGKNIPNMTDDEIEACDVFARVSPQHKQDIVKALQNKKHIVAMTGDGVNDAPALKNANIGIAMGITGTDVSKEAAVMVLADDNFATIVNAVEEGRGIYDNIKKFINYLLSSNIMEILLLTIAAIIGFLPPLSAIGILWINLVTDGPPALALAFDPYDTTLMTQKPRPVDEPFLTKNFLIMMISRGIILTTVILGFHTLSLQTDGARAQSVTFYLVIIAELTNAVNCRSEYNSIFKIGFFTSKAMIGAILFSLGLTALLFIPGSILGSLFGVVPLELVEYLYGIIIVVIVIGSIELLKLYFRRKIKL